jgi:hypothetical protein
MQLKNKIRQDLKGSAKIRVWRRQKQRKNILNALSKKRTFSTEEQITKTKIQI